MLGAGIAERSALSTSLRFAVVIPVARYHQRLDRCLQACARLTYEPRTIAVVSDVPMALPDDPHFVNVVTNAGCLTSPGAKRDAVRAAIPDVGVYAYLDDDAYPPPDWLENGAQVLAESPQAAGAGGPGLAADDQTFWEQVSAAVLASPVGSGPLHFRFWPDPPRDCDDYPAYALFIRRHRLDAAGGWATDWYGGEDSALCARLAARGGLIRYDPRLAVWHYRRRLAPEHAWQVWNVGRSRGCLIRAGDPYSWRWMFGGPLCVSIAVIAAVVAALILAMPVTAIAAACLAAYLGLTLFGLPGRLSWAVRLIVPLALLVHHGSYASGMVVGLLTGERLKRGGSGSADVTLRRFGDLPDQAVQGSGPHARPAIGEGPA